MKKKKKATLELGFYIQEAGRNTHSASLTYIARTAHSLAKKKKWRLP